MHVNKDYEYGFMIKRQTRWLWFKQKTMYLANFEATNTNTLCPADMCDTVYTCIYLIRK
jgi:hypothetical protein